jgi:hypothetical protein
MQMSTIVKGGLKALKIIEKGAVKHLPTILTAVGSAGVIGGVILAVKKTPDAKKELDKEKKNWEDIPDKENRVKADYIFKCVRIGAQHYWLVGLIIAGSLTCFWLANRISLKRLTSALTAAGLSAKAKEELEQKIKELDGEKHLQNLRDDIDKDRILNNPPEEDKIINTGLGSHLCYEPITGRYFYSNIERIRKAVIMCRNELQKEGYLSVNDWFASINLDSTDLTLCWTADSIGEVNDFDISTSSQLTSDDIPVLVIRYDINPTMERPDW